MSINQKEIKTIKKKNLVVLLALVVVSVSAFALTACSETTDDEKDKTTDNGIKYTLLANDTYEVTSGKGSDVSGEITIPSTYEGKSVTSIGKQSFYGNPIVTSVTIPDSVKTIGEEAFKMCNKLVTVKMTDSVTSIGKDAFAECTVLSDITLSNAITELSGTFYNCKAITSFTVPSGVKRIVDAAFSGCDNMESVTIPASVTKLGVSAFWGCSKLTSINFGVTKQQWNFLSKEDNWNAGVKNCTVHCSDGDA